MGSHLKEHEKINEAGDLVQDICNKTAAKKKEVDDLKFNYEKVQLEVQLKMDELKKLKESNSLYHDYLNSRQYMLNELQKMEEGERNVLLANQQTTAALRDEIDKVREIKNLDMTKYENKVIAITEMFVNAPNNFSQESMSEKKKALLEIHNDLKKELKNIQSDLEDVNKKFNLEEFSVMSEKDNLAQLEAMKAAEMKEVEEQKKLEEELLMLGKMSNDLQKELELFKQQHK